MPKCLNCEAEVQDSFCPECGQSTKVGRLSWNETVSLFLNTTLYLEGRLPRTLGMMFARPGRVVREYLEGKRRKYYNPISFFVITSAFYILVRQIIGFDPLADSNIRVTGEESEVKQFYNEAAMFMANYINHILLFLVMSLAANLKIFFWKRYRFVEYFVPSFYVAGLYIFVGTFFMLIKHYFIDQQMGLQFGIFILYTIFTCAGLFQKTKFWFILKYILLAFLSVVGYIFFGYLFSMGMVALFG